MDDLERIYREGYQAGNTGVKQTCPREYYDSGNSERRDAWVDGYKEGRRDHSKQYFGYDLRNVTTDPAVHGTLWVEPKDQYGFVAIRDCEGGTLLVKMQIDPEPRVLIPKSNVTPEMAHIISRAVQKAASLTYKIQVERKAKLANARDLYIPPAKPQAPKPPATHEEHKLDELAGRALELSKTIRQYRHLLHYKQETGGYQEDIRARMLNLIEQFDELYGNDNS